jgi:AmiR/NasT family two-component response regulator
MSGHGSKKAPDWRAVDPRKIATECSPRHVQSVLEDAQRDIVAAEKLADELAAFSAALVNAARMLLKAQSPHMTHRNASEREAYALFRAAVAKIDGGAS